MTADKSIQGQNAGNSTFQNAKNAKQDEFYTQLNDIAAELINYKEHFEDKTILCNCDDPYESNFFKYFALKFNEFKLKKLICTCWDGSPIVGTEYEIDFPDESDTSLSATPHQARVAYRLELTREDELEGDNAINLNNVKLFLERHRPQRLEGHGDFRSEECIELLKQADIVVTNPPFSLFREYVALLIKYEKKFLIIGNQNAVCYKEIFPLIKENEIWLGVKAGDMAFRVPDYYEERDTRFWIDGDNKKWRSLGNICWFTNLDHNKRHYPIDLYKHYNSEEYPKYDNYDAINIGKTSDIPVDYDGVMGVPITFLDKYCPEQFEILGITENIKDIDIDNPLMKIRVPNCLKYDRPYLGGKRMYARLLIRRKPSKQ